MIDYLGILFLGYAAVVVGCLIVSIPARRHELWHRRRVGRAFDPYRKVR